LVRNQFRVHWETTLDYFTLSIFVDYFLNNIEDVIDK